MVPPSFVPPLFYPRHLRHAMEGVSHGGLGLLAKHRKRERLKTLLDILRTLKTLVSAHSDTSYTQIVWNIGNLCKLNSNFSLPWGWGACTVPHVHVPTYPHDSFVVLREGEGGILEILYGIMQNHTTCRCCVHIHRANKLPCQRASL